MSTLQLTKTAVLTTDYETSEGGVPVLVFADGRVCGPNDDLETTSGGDPIEITAQEFVTATKLAMESAPLPDLLRDFLLLCSPKMVCTYEQIYRQPPPPTPGALVAWRDSEGLSQQAAGIIAGVRLRTWQRWEYGERAVPHWLADVLRYRLGVGP